MYAYVHTNGSVWALSVIYSDFVANALWQFIDFCKSKVFFSHHIFYISYQKGKQRIKLSTLSLSVLCNIIGAVFLARVSGLLLFTPVCMFNSSRSDSDASGQGTVTATAFPLYFAPETCGSSKDLFTTHWGLSSCSSSSDSFKGQRLTSEQSWNKCLHADCGDSHLQSHHSRSQVQGWPGLHSEILF